MGSIEQAVTDLIDDEFADDEVSNKPGHKPGHISESMALNSAQQRILDELRDSPNVTQRQLMGSLGLARSTIQEAMAHLRKNGHIERVGSRKTGWWRVLK